MKALFATLAAGLLVALSWSADSGRQQLSLDFGWRFHLGDIPHTAFRANGDEAEGGSKGASAWGAASPGFDDKSWGEVDLPHDWVIEQPFDEHANRSQGYRFRGIGWYRRSFRLGTEDRGRHLELKFDGVATHCTVWFNGSVVHRNWNGYTSFSVDITPMAKFGDQTNSIAVRVDADDMEGWWYEGAGIYRHTWLVKSPTNHIVTDGVYANPVKGANGKWSVPVEVTVENSGTAASQSSVESVLVDPSGKTIATGHAQVSLKPWERGTARLNLQVTNPRLWSTTEPTLYKLTTRATTNGQTDAQSTQCGFRTLAFSPQQGFLLNGKRLLIQGVCCHQDHAGVGVAVPDSLWEYRLRKLKEMGANAYRCAHNPPAKEFLDACDRMGILVMDENRNFSTSDECLGQLEWLVRRDRNHPSVFMWSLFNEENALQGTEQGKMMARRMIALVKSLDSSRAITAAQNGGQLGPDLKINPSNTATELDVVGINYQVDKYDQIRAAYPSKPIISSEDTSQVMTRGAFATDWSKLVLASYDDKYPGWASDNRGAWEDIAKRPSFGGGFIWTGFDYHGEPSPFGWPAVSSYFGCLDLCGFPKTAFYIRQALWIHEKPIIKLVPHWNWAGKDGQPIRVMAVTNADSVALFLNGKLIEEKKVNPFRMVEWQVPYAPGRLEAVAKNNGQVIGKDVVETTGVPVALRLIPDRQSIAADGYDALPITVEAVDSQGRVVPTANPMVQFEVSGPASIIGLGNGDPTSHEPEKGKARSLFNGLAQLIVQAKRDGAGEVVIRARSEGLAPAEQKLSVRASVPQ